MDDQVDELSLKELLLESIAWWKLDGEEGEQSTESSIRLSGEELVDLAKQVNDLRLSDTDEDGSYYAQCRERLSAYCREMRRQWEGRSPY
jgi:hypothetical protein